MISFSDKKELETYIENNILFTWGVAEKLDCLRQYIYKLVKQGSLTPIKASGKERVFLKENMHNFLK